MDLPGKEILKLWPEIKWIEDPELQLKTARVWEKALEKSVLTGRLSFRFLMLEGNVFSYLGANYLQKLKKVIFS